MEIGAIGTALATGEVGQEGDVAGATGLVRIEDVDIGDVGSGSVDFAGRLAVRGGPAEGEGDREKEE